MEIPLMVRSIFKGELLPLSITEQHALSLVDLNRLAAMLEDAKTDLSVQSLLSVQEKEIFKGFSYKKRRIEWLGGRLAAKKALCQSPLSGVHWNEISILPQEHGQPGVYYSGQQDLAEQVSISHSVDFAVALANASGTCGVDIQQFSDRLMRVQERFASGEELSLLQDETDDVRRLGLLWAAKEAMKKCFFAKDSSFFGHFHLVRAQKTESHLWQFQCALEQGGKRFANIQVVSLQQYALAAVQGGNNA
nr:4'-phosphopantetheinyl transferase superfamily protein [uncultured Desulfobulbus sp.]